MGRPFVDPRVHYVGVSYLRKFDARELSAIEDVFVIQHKDLPLAVLVPYADYLQMQSFANKASLDDALKIIKEAKPHA